MLPMQRSIYALANARKPFLSSICSACRRGASAAASSQRYNRESLALGLSAFGTVCLLADFASSTASCETIETKLPQNWAKSMPSGLLRELQAICGEDLGWAKSKKAKKGIVDEDHITTDEDTRLEHSKSPSSYHDLGEEKKPFVVVFPETEQQICEIVEACNRYKMPVIPWGGGTSLEGHLLTPKCGVSIDMCNFDQIIDFQKENQTVVCQAGVGYISLNEELAKHGFWFPLDPGPGATVGGMAANSCSGSTACKYGTMRESTISVNAVLANGQLVKTASHAPKTSAGYNLTNLMVGSEGTLGVITQVMLRVFPKPKYCGALLAFFPEIGDAARCAQSCKAAGVDLGRCEMMDDSMIKIVNAANGASFPEKSCLMFDIHGGSSEEVQNCLTTVRRIVGEFHGSDMRYETNPDKMKELWSIRKECLWSCSTARPSGSAMITDVCVPQNQLAEVVFATKVELKDRLESRGIPAPIVAHTLDGNFHAFIMIDTDSPEEMELAHDVAHNMVHRAIDAGGSCTGEHGIGSGKIEYLEHEVGPAAVQMMMTIKNALDPNNIMNPNKVTPNTCSSEIAVPARSSVDKTRANARHYVLPKKGGHGYKHDNWS